MGSKVDDFFSRAGKWSEEMEALRNILLECGLDEDLKWGKPCYAYHKSNIAIIQPFKEFCALLFFKGSLLKDTENILVKTGENTQAGRQLRFAGVKQVKSIKAIIKAYVFEAVEVEKAGLKVSFRKTEEHDIPEEFQNKLNEMPALKTAFSLLTPGRQRAYLLFFKAPKQSKTREARIEKYLGKILMGKGIND